MNAQSDPTTGLAKAPGRRMLKDGWLGLGIAAIALLALMSVRFLRSEQQSLVAAQRTYATLAVADILPYVDEAEAEQHEYLLTGQPSYREAYNRSCAVLDQKFDRLQDFAKNKNNAREQQQIEKLRSLVDLELMELQKIVDARSRVGFQAARLLALTGHSGQLSHTIHEHIRGISDMEKSTLAAFSREWSSKRRMSLAGLVGSECLMGCCLLIGWMWLTRGESQRRRSEEALQASEKRFETLCEQAPVGIYETDAQGLGVYANPRWSEISGLSLGESIGHGWEKALHPDDRAKVIEGWKPAARRGASWEYRLITPQGEVRWIRGLGGPIYSKRGDLAGYVGTIEDVTERKRAEDTAREALQQLQLITDNMPAAVCRCSSDLRYVWVSRNYTWVDRPREELVGRSILDVLGSGGYEVFRPHIEKVLCGQKDEFETRVGFPPGGARWVHVVYVPTTGQDLKVDGWIAVVTDVTDRHKAEERLRESEARFRAAFFQAAVGIAQTSVDGKWQLFNDRFCEIFGYSREELREKALIEKTLLKIAHPDDREAFLAARHKLLNGEISSWSSEGRYIRKDGVIGWARVFVSLVRNQDNEPQYFVTVVEDITEKIQAERALQQSQQELRALAGRLIHAQDEERKRISRELHDELSQKLALLAIDTGGLLAEPAALPEKMSEQLRNLQARVQKVAQNVRQISHQLHPSIVDDLGLVAALAELCDEFSAREGIEVTCEAEDVPRVLPVDIASSLYRVSQEALHNILKHAQASRVRLMVKASPEGIHLCVHDNGVGFDADAGLSRPGLGLVSMKERISLVQGEFSIDSRPGQGTEVKVFIPLSRKAA